MARAAAPALAVGGPPRVNLMPRAETERRAAAALLRRWLWCLVAALAVVAIAVAGAFGQEFGAAAGQDDIAVIMAHSRPIGGDRLATLTLAGDRPWRHGTGPVTVLDATDALPLISSSALTVATSALAVADVHSHLRASTIITALPSSHCAAIRRPSTRRCTRPAPIRTRSPSPRP